MQKRPGLTVRETYDLYTQAILKSDLEGLFTTVTDNEKFFFLTSTGTLIDTRQGYYKFHEEWFQEKEWTISFELLDVQEGVDYGFTHAIFHYQGKSLEGETYGIESYFTLVFHKQEGTWKVVSDICTPIRRYYTESDSKIRYSPEQKFLFEAIQQRRTVRQFKSTPVPKEHILKILDAARYAPTAGNQQPWKFLVIQDRTKIEQLKENAFQWYMDRYKMRQNPGRQELESMQKKIKEVLGNVLSAPVYVAVLVDSQEKYPDYVLSDGTLAAGCLMIAARALGYGTGFFTTFFPEEQMKKFFHIPDPYRWLCLTPIGIPEKWPEMPPKKKLENMVFFDSMESYSHIQ
ncbi:MAG: nitroreductase family protein [Candidatus Aminicenantales bacterium]